MRDLKVERSNSDINCMIISILPLSTSVKGVRS